MEKVYSMQDRQRHRASLCEAGRILHSRGFVPATSGNFSLRHGKDYLVTRSGVHKGFLQEADILLVDKDFAVIEGDGKAKPSAEAALHIELYQMMPKAQCALHYHSSASTVLSRYLEYEQEIVLRDYELLKAFQGIDTHAVSVLVPIFANSQDMSELASKMRKHISEQSFPAFLIASHGVYVWGNSLDEAMHHQEALEFLLQCELDSMQIKRG